LNFVMDMLAYLSNSTVVLLTLDLGMFCKYYRLQVLIFTFF
jgi:hypothetical protein